jgi:hypothetical protein
MLMDLPVTNTMLFLAPITMDEWVTYEVPAIVGVIKKTDDGRFIVIDAIACNEVPDIDGLRQNARFTWWANNVGGEENLWFDVFLTPQASYAKQIQMLTLLERSCGFKAAQTAPYAHAI